ncbi:hypothetical protein LAZ67_1001638 [Cordylochernes scorpioides]|uniref:ATP-dependent DNA helicase n=1 Tax=Cordylochernes scorpioides TaxID=51811 RepID=A0ABY6JVV9_9ARAC|nr:hypothetical protein LAZ67_1001638 [Cordylochernes scorpioides]
MLGFHRRAKAKTSLEDDDVPIDDTTTKPLFTLQENGRKGTRDKVPRLRWNPWQKHVKSRSRMCSHVLEVQILTGTNVGHTVLVQKISFAPLDISLPFILKRHQFSLRLAFAMTTNKAQGQTFARVGLLLQEPVFMHGQL